MDFTLEKTKVLQDGPIKILLALKDIDGNLKTSDDYTGIKLTVKERDEYDPDVYNDMTGLTDIVIPISCILDTPGTYDGTEYNFEYEAAPTLPNLFPKRRWSYIIHFEFEIPGKKSSVWEHEFITN